MRTAFGFNGFGVNDQSDNNRLGSSVPAPSYPFINSEAQALAARMSPTPDNARSALIDNLVGELKDAFVWAKFDAFYLFAAHSSQAALLNWVSTSYDASAVGSPAFTVDRGFAGDGVGAYIETNFTPMSAPSPKYVQNSAHMAVWSRTAAQDATVANDIGKTQARITCRSSADTAIVQVNQSLTSIASGVTDGSGHFLASRPDSATNLVYRNGSSLSVVSRTSSAVSSGSMRVLSGGTGFSIRQAAAASFGEHLASFEALATYSALSNYLTAVGAA